MPRMAGLHLFLANKTGLVARGTGMMDLIVVMFPRTEIICQIWAKWIRR